MNPVWGEERILFLSFPSARIESDADRSAQRCVDAEDVL